MRRWIFVAMVCLADAVHGQDYFYNADYLEPPLLLECGLRSGIIASLTDIGPKRSRNLYLNELNTRSPGYFGGVSIAALWKRKLGFTAGLAHGVVGGSDSSSNAEGTARTARNLHVKTSFTEIFGRVELNLVSIFKDPGTVSPYIFTGGGICYYDPSAYLNGRWVPLRRLHTEGQSAMTQYRAGSGFISAGIGLYMDTGPGWTIRIEWDHRFLFTDHFDDISGKFIDPRIMKGKMPEQDYQDLLALYSLTKDWNGQRIDLPGMSRGNSNKNDGFAGISLTICRVLNRKRV